MRIKVPKPSPAAVGRANAVSALMDAALVAVLTFGALDALAPPQDLFWKPLSLDRPLGSATRVQLARAVAEPGACRAALREAEVAFTEVPARSQGDCRLEGAVRLDGGVTPLTPAAPVMSCPLALSYALWDRQVVRPRAEQIGARLSGIEHFGTYACRNVYGRAEGRRSQHAGANAIDVAAFRLSGIGRVTISRDFHSKTEAGSFLRGVRDDACKVFGAVLSPDYNAAHRNHLHLDRGPFSLCN